MLQAPAPVQAAEVAAVESKHKGGGGRGKKLKPGQGARGGQKVRNDAARATDEKSRREGREKVRAWIGAARVDAAVVGLPRPPAANAHITAHYLSASQYRNCHRIDI